MILHGNQRGGARDLAAHLLKSENEHISVHELRGFAATDLYGALREAEAIARGTRCRQHLFSVSLNPPPQHNVRIAIFEGAIEQIERSLGLEGQPRAIVFHEKEGRRHAHAVWSRINEDSMTAINLPFTHMRLRAISRALFIEHEWRMPPGLIEARDRDPLNFDQAEAQQAKRAKADPKEVKAHFREAWDRSDGLPAYAHALEERGYVLARGDRRAFVAVDAEGEVYAVARWSGVKTKDVRGKLGSPDGLPNIEEAQTKARALQAVRDRQQVEEDIRARYEREAQSLNAERKALRERHAQERQELLKQHAERQDAESKQRAQRFVKGLRGLWQFVTGERRKIALRNAREADEGRIRDRDEVEGLIAAQLRERRALQAEITRSRQAMRAAMERAAEARFQSRSTPKTDSRSNSHEAHSRER